ncbi:unnamed protein product, partial [Mesorhabditis belari]|uniref:Uncharacterized protein n=1 Tax=Mesorhabditis belari TaxID=2138241 RepID=A0AAF3FSU0_9BILA
MSEGSPEVDDFRYEPLETLNFSSPRLSSWRSSSTNRSSRLPSAARQRPNKKFSDSVLHAYYGPIVRPNHSPYGQPIFYELANEKAEVL